MKPLLDKFGREVEMAYLQARCKAITERAIKVTLFEGLASGNSVWIPKKLIADDSQVKKRGDEGELAIPLWFCEQEGLL